MNNNSPPSYLNLNNQELNNSHLNDHQHMYLSLPSGYFLIQLKGGNSNKNNLVLDIKGSKNQDGTEICLHSQKDPILNRSNSLRNSSNNQVFHLNWSGHLCSASSPGSYIDAILSSSNSTSTSNFNSSTSNTSSLQLLTPQPLYSIPSRSSHPPPQFSLDPDTSTLHVLFGCDPNFPGPATSSTDSNSGNAREWMETEYILESVPRRKRKVVRDPERTTEGWNFSDITTSQAATNAVGLLSTFKWGKRLSVAASSAILSTQNSNHHNHSQMYPNSTIIEESDDDENDHSDSEPDGYRSIRLVSLPIGWRQTLPSSMTSIQSNVITNSSNNSPQNKRLWSRRQFKILPISVEITPPSMTSSIPTVPFPTNSSSGYLPNFTSPGTTSTSPFASNSSPSSTSPNSSRSAPRPHTVAQSSPFVLELPESESSSHSNSHSPLTSLLSPSPSSTYSHSQSTSSPTNHFSPSLPPRLSSSGEESSTSSPEFDSPILPTGSESPLPSVPPPNLIPPPPPSAVAAGVSTATSSNFYTQFTQAASTLSHNALSVVQQAALSSSSSATTTTTLSNTSSSTLANKRISGGNGPRPLTLAKKVAPASPTKGRGFNGGEGGSENGDNNSITSSSDDKIVENGSGGVGVGGEVERFGLGIGTLVRRISLGSSSSSTILPVSGSITNGGGTRSNRSSISSGFSTSSSSATSATSTTFSGSIGIGRRSRIPSSSSTSNCNSTSTSISSAEGGGGGGGYAPHNNPGPNKRDSLASLSSSTVDSSSPILLSSIETSPVFNRHHHHHEKRGEEREEEEEEDEEEEERRGSPRDRFTELSRNRILLEEKEESGGGVNEFGTRKELLPQQTKEEEEKEHSSTITKRNIRIPEGEGEREKVGLLEEDEEEEEMELEIPGQAL